MSAVLICVNILSIVAQDENLVCTATYCKDVSCSGATTNCDIQNATHRGIEFPSPDTCNCCKYCLNYLNENAVCSTGSPDGSTVTSVCGPGLTCKDNKCQTMETECYLKRKDYQERLRNGTAGTMEVAPECDGSGFYDTYKCIPGQTCYCVHKNGSRIFGQSEFVDMPSQELNCGCSRSFAQALEITGKNLLLNQHLRCASNGDYDTLQCINDKTCFCVDKIDGTPLSSDQTHQMENIEKLSCFDSKIHSVEYYKPCEQEYLEILKEVEELASEGYSSILAYKYPNCDLDGSYAPVQENKTHKMCVDQQGKVLVEVELTRVEAETMNCKCARASKLVTSTDIPVCSENGNYEPVQCRRGFCRCVDEDGNQVCGNYCPDVPQEEVPEDGLNCP